MRERSRSFFIYTLNENTILRALNAYLKLMRVLRINELYAQIAHYGQL